MTRILQLISLIAVVMVLGCERESRSSHVSDAVLQKPKVGEVKNLPDTMSDAGRARKLRWTSS